MRVSIDDILAARTRIRDAIFLTPCRKSTILSRETGKRVYLKLDNLQMTGSFKERGARNKLMSLSAEERKRGVIAASAGNHAQAVAYHGSELGIKTKIVMPLGTPLIKVERTKSFGGEVVLAGENFGEAYQVARGIEETEGRVFVHPFNDEAVIAGQGTLGLEILEQMPDVDIIVVAIGGGGLISGVATAVKALKPSVRIIGVEPEVLPSMKAAVEAGKPVEIAAHQTLADGVSVRKVGEFTREIVSDLVDEIVTVTEREIARSILVLLEQEKTLAEGAGAASLAAIRAGKIGTGDEKICAIICGGNIDMNIISRIIENGLVAAGRLQRIAIQITDTPGTLAKILSIVGDMKGNILEVRHDPTFTSGSTFGSTNVILKIETKNKAHFERIKSELNKNCFKSIEFMDSFRT